MEDGETDHGETDGETDHQGQGQSDIVIQGLQSEITYKEGQIILLNTRLQEKIEENNILRMNLRNLEVLLDHSQGLITGLSNQLNEIFNPPSYSDS